MTQSAQDISASMNFSGRKMDFGFDFKDLPRYWYDDDPVKTHLLNALSCLFLEGERIFIDSVRAHEHLITDERLKEQVKNFIKQEAIHGNEHHQFSEYLDTLGFPATQIEREENRVRKFTAKILPASHRLAITCAIEHFTAMFAHELLTNPELQKGMDPRIAELWKWHAVEETEHKGVCFDVYQHCNLPYRRRVFYMVTITATFLMRMTQLLIVFLWRDKKLFKWSSLKSGFRFFWKNPGIFPAIAKDYFAYYRRDFHPWQHDNRELLEAWEDQHDNYKLV